MNSTFLAFLTKKYRQNSGFLINRASYEVGEPLILTVSHHLYWLLNAFYSCKPWNAINIRIFGVFYLKYRWNSEYLTFKPLMVSRFTSHFDQARPDVSLLLCMIKIVETFLRRCQRYQLIDLVERTHTFVASFFRNRAYAQQIHRFSLLTRARIGNLVHDCTHPTSLTFPPHHLTIPTLQKTYERSNG